MLGKLPFLCVEQDRRGGGEVHATKEVEGTSSEGG